MGWSYGPGLRRLWARVRVWVGVMDQGYGSYGPGLGYGLELWTRVKEAMDQARGWVGVMDQG